MCFTGMLLTLRSKGMRRHIIELSKGTIYKVDSAGHRERLKFGVEQAFREKSILERCCGISRLTGRVAGIGCMAARRPDEGASLLERST